MNSNQLQSNWKLPLHFKPCFEQLPVFEHGFLIEICTLLDAKLGRLATRLELLILDKEVFLLESFGLPEKQEFAQVGANFGSRRSLFREDYVDRNLAVISEHFLYNYFRQGLYPFPNHRWEVLSSRGALSVDSINMAWEFAVNDELAGLENLVQHDAEF